MLFLVLNLLGRELLLMTVHHNMDESAVLFLSSACFDGTEILQTDPQFP